MALDEQFWAEAMPVLQEMVNATVTAALRTSTAPKWMSGSVAAASGSDCDVEPDDAPGSTVPATRMSPAIVEGSRVQLMFGPGGFVMAFGPIPQ